MLRVLLLSSLFLTANAHAQTTEKPNPDSSVNAEEQVNGLPGAGAGRAYSVRTKKSVLQVPSKIAPVENHAPANCADSLGAKGSANFTACEAAKKTR